jgi:ubiquinone/menaquinone biosynthesis C-methylase UbiE
MSDEVSFVRPREHVPFDGERCTPWVTTEIHAAHMHRYLAALPLCQGKSVLDIACGEGYGSAMLKKNGASEVTGADIASDVIARATRIYATPGLTFTEADIRARLPFEDDAFDTILSFETLEHVATHDLFLAELRRILAPGGVLVISTPDARQSDPDAPNPFHEKELLPTDFLGLIRQYFTDVETYHQGYLLGSVIQAEDEAPGQERSWERLDFTTYRDNPDRLTAYVLAVASDGPSGRLDTGTLHDHVIVSALRKRVRELETEVESLQAVTATQREQT